MSELKFQLDEFIRFAPITTQSFNEDQLALEGRRGRVLHINTETDGFDGKGVNYWARYTIVIDNVMIIAFDDEFEKLTPLEQLAGVAE